MKETHSLKEIQQCVELGEREHLQYVNNNISLNLRQEKKCQFRMKLEPVSLQ